MITISTGKANKTKMVPFITFAKTKEIVVRAELQLAKIRKMSSAKENIHVIGCQKGVKIQALNLS